MATKKMQGVHCGRPLACVLEHNVERDRAKIKTDEKQQTKIIPMSVILDAANEGLSTGSLAKSIGVPRKSLEGMLETEGILLSYKEVSSDVRSQWRKGLVAKRAVALYANGQTSPTAERGKQGSLYATDGTLFATAVTNNESDDPDCQKSPVKKGDDGHV
jgi:hypothetical protein